MLKEFIQHIQETTRPEVKEIDGHSYQIDSGSEPFEILPEIQSPDTLKLTSLDALVKMVKTEALEDDTPLYITIPNPTTVRCFGQFREKERCYRRFYYKAEATDVPGWDSSVQFPFEEMQIALFTRFQDSNDMKYVQNLLSSITTTVMTQKGIALQDQSKIRPVVSMKPYRTFQEIDQPESPFLIRVTEHGIRLIESDGGMWKLDARKTIKDYLEKALEEEVAAGSVLVSL